MNGLYERVRIGIRNMFWERSHTSHVGLEVSRIATAWLQTGKRCKFVDVLAEKKRLSVSISAELLAVRPILFQNLLHFFGVNLVLRLHQTMRAMCKTNSSARGSSYTSSWCAAILVLFCRPLDCNNLRIKLPSSGQSVQHHHDHHHHHHRHHHHHHHHSSSSSSSSSSSQGQPPPLRNIKALLFVSLPCCKDLHQRNNSKDDIILKIWWPGSCITCVVLPVSHHSIRRST